MRLNTSMLRLDQALVERGLCPSREKAKRAVLAGQVRINARPARKPGDPVKPEDTLTLDTADPYVSRGGHKLARALDRFELEVAGLVALDLGASTGGFTDCLLQRGAAKVFAVDVGRGQLAWKLRRDPRVVVMEGTNARHLTAAQLSQPFDLVVMDCSFISLKKILPTAAPLLKPGGKMVALVKPQFEAGKAEADKGRGVIRDPAVHARILEDLREFVATRSGLSWRNVVESPLTGPAGNKEFLALIEKQA
ncbi:MAG: TlyA family RNA methyltransferase [Verrucomicrobiota bacterium]|nr:TlyA family RNA methyltransferase [Verrucomicrobiota bacterium]